MKIMYLDESGDHSLEMIDKDYPVFVLGGVIVERAYDRTELEPRIRQLKAGFLNDPNLILHTTDIIRGKNGFEALSDADTRIAFYSALNALMRELDYAVVACAIKKQEHLDQYGEQAADPYLYSLDIVVERFCHEIGDTAEGGVIFAEKRRPDLDHQLELAWQRLRRHGTDSLSSEAIDKRIIDLSLKDKRLNIAGLQLADLVVSPIGRFVLGKSTREDWQIVEGKLRRGPSGYQDYGLVVRPN